MAADDAQRLHDIELHELTKKLQKQLKTDIARIYSDSLFSDVEIVLGNILLRANCCILQARASAFYTELCSLQNLYSNGYVLEISIVEKIKSLVRKIYEENNIHATESTLVKLLKDVSLSPDFEQYATPLTSPSEVLESESCSLAKSNPHPSYYSIVPLDWEKELAEQDFLIESFRSILCKEQSKSRVKVRKSSDSKSQRIPTDPYSRSLLDLKKAVEEDCLLLQEEGVLCDIHCGEVIFDQPNSLVNSKKVVKCHIVSPLQCRESADACNEYGFFDAEDSFSLCNDSLLTDLQRGTSEKSKMSTNMDTGPDSGLATSAEDIPLDQEGALEVSKSISSSVSSDCCVWDSSAPQQSDLTSWVDSAAYEDNSDNQAEFVDRVLEELVNKSQSQKQKQAGDTTEVCFDALGLGNTNKNNFFIDASSLLDETEIQHASAGGGGDIENPACSQRNIACDVPIPIHSRTQEWQSLDERGELSSLPETDVDGMVNLNQKSISACSSTSEKKGSNSVHNTPFERKAYPPKKDKEEDKPPSLIRSNTFELKREDDHLTVLRQEYERRQGSLIFQRCDSQPTGPLSDVGIEDELSQHCTSLILPDSGAPQNSANMSLLFTHVVEDEIQTPDSLNSDLPETIGQEKCSDGTAEDLETGSLRKKVAGNGECTEADARDNLSSGVANLTLNEVSSPLFSRRKTESAPILSGAAPPLLPEIKPVERKVRALAGPLSSAWVVDISDITSSPEARRRRADLSSASSSEHQSSEFKNDQATPESKSLSSSLGFFVDMKDPKPPLDEKCDSMPLSEGSRCSRQSSDSGKIEKQGACEFFVDLNRPEEPQSFSPNLSDTSQPEKKLFSMFIDIGDKGRPKAKPDLALRSRTPLSPFSTKRKTSAHIPMKQSDSINGRGTCSDMDEKCITTTSVKSDSASSQTSATAHSSDHKRSNFFMFIESDTAFKTSKLVPPKSASSSSSQICKEKIHTRPQHVRAHSVSYVKKNITGSSDNSITSALTTTTRQLSSLSLQNAEALSGDDVGSAKKTMFSSCHASLQTEESQEMKISRNQDEMTECSELSSHVTTGSNESSACSLETYSVHTPEHSSATDDHSSEKKDSFKNFYVLKENESRGKPEHTEHRLQSQTSIVESKGLKESRSSMSDNKLKPDKRVTKSFVRLSDLDKEPVSSDQSASVVAHRMSRSIPETSWIERKTLMSHSAGGGSTVLSNSSRSLSRLFPNMSVHAGGIGRSKTSSTCSQMMEDFDTMRSSQVSGLSSMQSSVGLDYSTESTDISSDRGCPATQLGDDLLKMFLEEISTDVIVEVGGRRIKAHKCILSSRCQYFAAILSGGWVESAGNVISLQGFSFTVVHFALCHIYSGASTIPDQISIVELASLADMLSLEGLKDVIMYTLKVKYCHFFHKPCAVCSVGVLECLPLAAAYGLDDIYRKSLRWITKYFVRIWPTKSFTALPRDIIDKCYQQHIIHMTPENVLETILCCDKLLSTIPTVRWAEPVFVLTSRLMENCIKFMSDNFCAILASENFLALGREVPWNVSRFQDSLVAACERMPPDQSCRSYTQLCSVLSVIEESDPPPEMTWHPNFVDLLVQLRDLSERTLIRQAARAARTPGWGQMPTDLRRKIQDAACLVLTPADHASSRYKKSTNDGSRQVNPRSSYSRNLDLHQVKMAMAQHARRANGNDYHQTVSSVVVRKNIPSDRSNTVTRRSAPVASNNNNNNNNNKPAEKPMVTSQGRPKTWPAQVKSRYLEKRPNHSKQSVESQERNKQLDAPMPQRRVAAPVKGMFISSSDSSRNSSPAMKRSSTVSSNAKTLDSSSKPRATTVSVCNPTKVDAERNAVEEDVLFKSSDNLARRSGSSKALSVSETFRTPPPARKIELLSQDNLAKQERSNKHPSSALGNQTRSVSMSNDSLATVSSCEDTHSIHSGKNVKAKSSTVPKKMSAGIVESDKKPDSPRTPLSMANKKASPSNVQRRMPLLPSKTLDGNCTSSPSSLMYKRTISHSAKSPVLSNTGSRLAIPLRTSRSVSSVPDKGHLAVKVSEGQPGKKSIGKTQSRSIIVSGSSKRASLGSSAVNNASIASKALACKGSKANNSVIKSANCNNTEKHNGDNNLDSVVHPTVGPRSGTFLKDEPTVLQTPSVENN